MYVLLSFRKKLPVNSCTRSGRCSVVGKSPAQDIHPDLKGTAWILSCDMSVKFVDASQASLNSTGVSGDYYLEDLGLFLSDIGVYDYQKSKYVAPSNPDYKTTIDGSGCHIEYNYKNYAFRVSD